MSDGRCDDDNDDDSSQSSSAAAGPALPSGVLRPKGRYRGWAGEELEIDHRREHEKAKEANSEQTYAAVDIAQFQNTVVGEGYQAKHVVRQRSAQSSDKTILVKDMTGTGEAKQGEKKRKRDQAVAVDSKKNMDGGGFNVDKYLQLKALRDFRRELEKML